jgi:leucine dehydrogenase
MCVLESREYDDHRIVHYVNNPAAGLFAIIALHRINPRAAGGIRMAPYAAEADALRDALRLSRAMTYKWAFTGLERGGGKTVIIGDPRKDKSEALLHAVGEAIERLGGVYYAGADVGTSHEDMRVIQQVTSFVRGADPDHGDSSTATAYGVLQGIRAAAKWALGRADLDGLTVAVQGVGHVGAELCALLAGQGARLLVADVDAAAVERMVERFGARAVAVDQILFADADVVAPCAMGGVIDLASAANIRARIVCGGANNQLASDDMARTMHDLGILYVPDYTVNSGGIINGMAEGPDYDRAQVWAQLDRILPRTLEVFERAAAQGVTPLEAADEMCAATIRERD